MFTGLVEEIGHVLSVLDSETEGRVLEIKAKLVLQDCRLGDSIAVNGTCLTVTSFTSDAFKVGMAPETLRKTNLGSLTTGALVNLERSLSATQRFGGHFVQGHVDGVAEVLDRWVEKESLWFRLSIPKGFERYFIPKGYVALDGTSLTVCDVVDPSNHQGHQQEGGGDSSYFTIMLVAYTQKHVILPLKQKGDLVNVEVDMISKYVERNFLLSQSQHLSPLASASASENIRR